MKLLRTFAVTARTLNFHKAADQLFLAQPTVTQHIRQLEEELHVQLFDRSARQVRLTAAGDRFLEYANQVLAVYEKGVEELTAWHKGYRDRLVLATSPLVARSTLPQVVKRFAIAHPDVEVVVKIVLSGEVAQMVAERRAHLGLTRVASQSRDLHSYVWYTDPVRLVVPHDVERPTTTVPDWREVLATSRLLTHNHPDYWDDLLLAIHNQGIHVRTMEVSLVDVTKIFIEEGLGVSFLPQSTLTRELAEGRLLEVPTPGLAMPVAATHVIHLAQGPSRQALDFIACLA